MCGDIPSTAASAARRPGTPVALSDLMDAELDRLEKAAAGAQPTSLRHRGWVALPSDSGLTEAQEDFIDYWSPRRVLDDCRAKRRLLAWVSDQRQSKNLSASHEEQLDRLLRSFVTGKPD